jgi:hypothetical protein
LTRKKVNTGNPLFKWQAKATTSPKPCPTLHEKPAPKPEQRASSIASDSDDDLDPTFPPLHYRMTIDDASDDDDNSPTITDIVVGLGDVDMFDDPGPIAPSPVQLDAIFADVDRQLRPTQGLILVVDSQG